MKDVGRAELGAESYSTASALSAGATPSASASCSCRRRTRSQVYRDVSAELERLSKRFPPGLKVEVAFDTTTVVSESIREVRDDAARGDRARHRSSCSCSCRTGARR